MKNKIKKTSTLGVRVHESVKAELEKRAKKTDRSVSYIVNSILSKELNVTTIKTN